MALQPRCVYARLFWHPIRRRGRLEGMRFSRPHTHTVLTRPTRGVETPLFKLTSGFSLVLS